METCKDKTAQASILISSEMIPKPSGISLKACSSTNLPGSVESKSGEVVHDPSSVKEEWNNHLLLGIC